MHSNNENGQIVVAENLTRKFGNFVAVDHLNFSIEKGEIFGFLGANGAGKTTTIRMLCGLLLPTSGSASVAGFDIYSQADDLKHHIGYMSQRFSLYEDLTVLENIEFYGGIYGLARSQIRQKSETLLHYLKLNDRAGTLTTELPLGLKQRLALSIALLHDPEIIFLDEPTSGVDPHSRRQFWMLIYRLAAQGKTVIVTTHFLDEAEYCQRVAIMSQGKIVELNTPQNLKQKYKSEAMQTVFLRVIGEDGR